MHADAQRGEFVRPGFSQNHKAPFGTGIGAGAVVALLAAGQIIDANFLGVHPAGGHIDNARIGCLPESGQKQTGQQAGGQQVRSQGLLDALAGIPDT